jgi:nicotinamidase/pyrazinamidase
MEIFFISAAVLVVGVGLLILILVLLAGPTKGPKIREYTDPQKALLVIDVQEDFTGRTAKPPFPYKNSKELITSVNEAIENAAGKGFKIVYIRQEFDGFAGKVISRLFGKGTAVKGRPGTEIDERISIVNDNVFPKPKGDAFSNPDLSKFLVEHNVNELFLTGLDAEFCVYHTAKGALNRGYKVNIIPNCIALRAEKKWVAILRRYERDGIILKEEV